MPEHPGFPVTIYHNPRCGTSRAALELIRAAGITPQIIDYMKTLPDLAELTALAAKLGGHARELLRAKEPGAAALGLLDPERRESELIAAIAADPALLNRPIVVTPKGARACRPAELLRELLP